MTPVTTVRDGRLSARTVRIRIATTAAPSAKRHTGKLFASVMAFVSVGSVITTLFFTLSPIFAQIWKEMMEKAEEEVRSLEKDVTPKKDEKTRTDDA